jgi:hypothetical protein
VDRVGHLGVQLSRCYKGAPFHGFIMGHPGVGKSTEISRLLLGYEQQFRPIRLSAALELFPGKLRIHDLLWLMIARVLDATSSATISGFSENLSPGLLENVREQLSERWIETLGLSKKDLELGLDLKLIAKIRATLKLSRERTEKTAEYTFSALSDLVSVVNQVFIECNEVLRKEKEQDWILVVEDFEKLGVQSDPLRQLFIEYSLLFDQLKAHLLFVIPVGLAYIEEAERMPFGRERQFMIPDIAVFTRDHEVDEEGIEALLEVIYRRVDANLLEESLARSLAIASGGNIRDLFDLLRRSSVSAEVRESSRIERSDAIESVNALRANYRLRLGENPFNDTGSVSIEVKLEKLQAIYRGDPAAQIPDKTLYLLLRQRIVLQFNGQFWFGVHPLVRHSERPECRSN